LLFSLIWCRFVYEQHSGDFHEFRTRRHFTLFTIYLTPEHGTFVLFSMSFCSGKKKIKKHQCVVGVCRVVVVVALFLNSRGKFYTSLYYFLVASGNKRFFLKCPCCWFRFGRSSSPKKMLLVDGENKNVKPSSVESSFKACGPMAAE